MDEEGYYKIVGRLKDMIIRGGENIYPREIEEFLYTVPGIRDVQVVGVPDEKYGEVVGAFVMLHDGADVAEEDIRDLCRQKMARYKAPRYVFFVDSFPQNRQRQDPEVQSCGRWRRRRLGPRRATSTTRTRPSRGRLAGHRGKQ